MSSMNDAFWHKGQQNVVGSCMLGHASIDINGSEQTSWSQVPFMVQGETRNLNASGAAGSGTVLNLTNFTAGLNANNPIKTVLDDSNSSLRTVRQNFVGLEVADGYQVRAIGTVERHATANTASTILHIHFYAGEVVANTQTARRPELDLSDEAPLVEILFKNSSGGALSPHSTGAKEFMDGTTNGAWKVIGMIWEYGKNDW